MASEADLHDVIDRAAREVGFGGYGRNLDALWDVLTGFLELPVQVRWVNARFNHAWGLRYDKIVRIFEDAERELGTEFKFEIMP